MSVNRSTYHTLTSFWNRWLAWTLSTVILTTSLARTCQIFQEPPQMTTTRKEVLQRLVFLAACMGDFHELLRSNIAESHAMDQLLRTSFMDRCIRGIFSIESRIVQKSSRPRAMIMSFPKVLSVLEGDILENVNANCFGSNMVPPSFLVGHNTRQSYALCLLSGTSPATWL